MKHLNRKLKSTELLSEIHTNVSSAGLSTTINHNLGVVPNVVIISPKSEATDYISAVNASQVTITTTVSGASFDVTIIA